ncbi:hypothetical protein PR048_012846 [Dryococelus australis]|uniref:Uncharacterized protein n=1 Tax=Dryococelus australis TaxID=614101 RepID=A0ABQ9HQI3_9NEOP|nr:hypothetical protein PR048_012846 [Dryococelus australis]
MCQRTLTQFYCRDDVSHQAPGMKDVLSIKDSKTHVRSVQKRHMIMTVKEAFIFFQNKFPEIKIKKSKFHELRPKHVILCSQMPHNVCICRYHLNISNIDELLSLACCDFLSEQYATGACEACANDILLPSYCDVYSIIIWQQWAEFENQRKLSEFEGSLEDAVNELNTFKVHAYVKKVQAKSFEECKLNAQDNHIIIQVDCAENYLATSQDKIQCAHWAHAQFKNKFTFFNLCFMNSDFGLEGEWVIFATSHGKGAVDGIGGCVNRLVWNPVKVRKFIVNSAKDFLNVQKTVVGTVNIVCVSSQKITESREMLGKRWGNVRPILVLQSKHIFKVISGNSLLVGRTSTSKLDICHIFKSKIEDI